MNPSGIDEEVRRFLRENIESYEELEVLLLLRALDAPWTADAISEKLRIDIGAVADALDRFDRRGMIEAEATPGAPRRYRLTPKLATTVERLARAYEEHRLEVMESMSDNAVERIRTAAIRTFANAFLVGKRKPDG